MRMTNYVAAVLSILGWGVADAEADVKVSKHAVEIVEEESKII